MKKTETYLKDKVFKFLIEEIGGCWFKMSGSIYQVSGIPDIIGCPPTGIFCGIELKQPAGKVGRVQQINIDKINKEGHGIGIKLSSFTANDKANLRDILLKKGVSMGWPSKRDSIDVDEASGKILMAYKIPVAHHLECQNHRGPDKDAEFFIPRARVKWLCKECVSQLGLKIKVISNI